MPWGKYQPLYSDFCQVIGTKTCKKCFWDSNLRKTTVEGVTIKAFCFLNNKLGQVQNESFQIVNYLEIKASCNSCNFYILFNFFRTMIELFYLSFSKAKKNAQFTKNHNIIICIHLIAMRLKRAEKWWTLMWERTLPANALCSASKGNPFDWVMNCWK